MKIAVISMIRDNWGGSEELWYEMAKTALREGHTVMHLSYDIKPVHPKLQELISLGLISYKRPTIRYTGGGVLVKYFKLGTNFFKKRMNRSIHKIFQQRPDIVLYNGTCYSIAEEKMLNRYIRKKKPLFFILGHFNPEKEKGISYEEAQVVKEMYQSAHNVFFIAARSKSVAENQLGITIQNGMVVRNPVNLDKTSPVEYPGTNNVFQFAMVGILLRSHKGQDIALSVLADAAWKNRNFHLNIYGEGPDYHYLQELAASYSLSDKVSFHGKVNDIRKLWENNHLLLMPSHMEGMPLAVVEAMLCARPVVATDVGGITEWVEHGKSGFIAESATPGSFAEALEKAWMDKERWREMGLLAHKHAMELYDPAAGKTLLDILKTARK